MINSGMSLIAAAAERWDERAATREGREGQPLTEIEAPERIEARLQRLQEAAKPGAAPQLAVATALPSAGVLREIGLERTLGTADFQNIAFLELALAVSRFVGRINIRSAPMRTVGYGTGSMVSPRLLLTNNHVLPDPASARFSEVEFDYQVGRDGRQLQAYPFALQPDTFFFTDQALDFTLVAVAERSTLDRDLKHYGWSRLIATQGKVLIGEHVNIVQHPRGQFKQFVSRDNKVVDLFDDYLHYTTDTEPGSSGSPVYNDQWEIVALHHSGVPRRVDGRYVDRAGKVWDGLNPDDLDWVANEGIRVSRIVHSLEAQQLTGDAARLRRELLEMEPPNPLDAAAEADEDAGKGGKPLAGIALSAAAARTPDVAPLRPGAVSITIPLRVTIELGVPGSGADTAAAASGATTVPASAPLDPVAPQPQADPSALPTPPETADALADLAAAPARRYYDPDADKLASDEYYSDLDADALDPTALFRALSDLTRRTHKTELTYKPAKHVYPWVDLRRNDPPVLHSIYSGAPLDPRELIEEDARIEANRVQVAEMLASHPSGVGNEADLLEAAMPFNCEHVVPQSWFGKEEPMRGDLHHLFACEPGCNSFRGNKPYFDFPDFEEAVRGNCGKVERARFEPSAGKGAVARATFYFLLRYPGLVGNLAGEMGTDGVATLLAWHRRNPVGEYERHRNAAIAEKQGNRNPLIDHPEWAEKIDFTLGFAGAAADEAAPVRDLASAIAAIAALDLVEAPDGQPALTEAAENFGRYEGLPAKVALLEDGRKLRLLAPLSYFDADDNRWAAPEGSEVDGASIPRVFWTLIGGPLEGRYRDASIIHDVYCVTRTRAWRDTHRAFYEAMRCSGVGEARAKVMYYAVHRFGPRWTVGQESTAAMAQPSRVPTDADAATLLADAEAIYAHGLDLDEIDNLAEARDTVPAGGPAGLTESTVNAAALARARRLVVTGGSGTVADLEAVATEAATLPGYVMDRFERKRIRIVACRESVTDFERSLRGVIPRGWEDTGKTWDDVPGTYLDRKKRVVVATIAGAAGRVVPTRESGKHGSISLTVHESLHGYDYSGDHKVLSDPTFLTARVQDFAKLDRYQRQDGQAGLEETFAESGSRFIAEPALFQQECPNLFGFWQGRPMAREAFSVHELGVAPETAAVEPADAPIGTIAQRTDGTLLLDLRAEGPGGAIGHALLEIPPSDPAYKALSSQLPPADSLAEATTGTREGLFRPFVPARKARAGPGVRPPAKPRRRRAT